jgi:two-component sensor histidine kinase
VQLSFRRHIALVGAIVILPFLLAGFVLGLLYIRAEQQSTEEQLVAAAKDLTNVIDREIAGGFVLMKTLASATSLKTGNFERFQERASEVAQQLPGSVIAVRTAEGQQRANTAVAWGNPLPRTSDSVLREADKRALESGRQTTSDLYIGASTGRPFISLVLPVSIGAEQHLMNLALPPEVVLRILEQSSLFRSENLLVVMDSRHRVIARSRNHGEMVGRTSSAKFVAMLKDQSGAVESTTLDGTPVMDGYYKSSLTGWTVVAAVPKAKFLHNTIAAGVVVLALGLISLLLSVFLGMLYGRARTGAIWRLRDDALALAARRPISAFATGITELNSVSEAIASTSETLRRQDLANKQLIDELNHRVKNSLVTMQSIARQTLARTADLKEFEAGFTGRLIALSLAHNTLSEGGWVDADLQTLANRICLRTTDPARLSIHGPSLRISPRATLTLGLVLHELTSNAARHGALQPDDGKVELSWSTIPRDDGQSLTLTWREMGRPLSGAPVERKFGIRFVESSIREELRGTTAFAFNPEGLSFECTFRI